MTQALLARADIAPAADLRLGDRAVRVTFGGLVLPDTAFPHLTLVRQMDVDRATWRLLATRPATPGRLEPGSFGPPVSAIDLQALMDQAGLDARITDLGWSARVTVQRRLASRFRRGQPFLAGDAAHDWRSR
jgi:2-polyprenyl-6-methoxyphenol hydroxylase-like FAD-dependent oxidoreductase